MFTCVLRRYVAAFPQFYFYPNLFEGADSVGEKECPFSDVTRYDRTFEEGSLKVRLGACILCYSCVRPA